MSALSEQPVQLEFGEGRSCGKECDAYMGRPSLEQTSEAALMSSHINH